VKLKKNKMSEQFNDFMQQLNKDKEQQ